MSVLPDRTAMSFEAWWTPVRVALIVWFIVHVVIFVSQWPAIAALRLADTDDAMRMAQVRDLLAGQGWWDLTQYTVNPADGGVLMHGSRIVDAPLAGEIGRASCRERAGQYGYSPGVPLSLKKKIN